jgi:hypothetical protein
MGGLLSLAALSATRVTFYATAATVIPVYLLAFAVQLQARLLFRVTGSSLDDQPVGRLLSRVAATLSSWP